MRQFGRVSARSLAACAALVFLVACGDDGEEEAAETTDVNAHASVFSYSNDQGPLVEARLFVFSDKTWGPIEGLHEATLVADGTEIPLERQTIRLGSGDTTVMFKASSQLGAPLEYAPGMTYSFRFTVTGFGSGGERTIEVVAPAAPTDISFSQESPTASSSVEVVTEDYPAGLLQASRAGTVTFSSFPVAESSVGSVEDLGDAGSTLGGFGGRIVTLPAEAFSSAGTYDVRYFGLAMTTESDTLGDYSSAVAGSATTASVEVR